MLVEEALRPGLSRCLEYVINHVRGHLLLDMLGRLPVLSSHYVIEMILDSPVQCLMPLPTDLWVLAPPDSVVQRVSFCMAEAAED